MATELEQLQTARSRIISYIASGNMLKLSVQTGNEKVEFRGPAEAAKALQLVDGLIAELSTTTVSGSSTDSVIMGRGRGYVCGRY